MKHRMLLLVALVLVGCTDTDPISVMPSASPGGEIKRTTDGENEQPVGINKCAIYRRPPFCEEQ